MALDTYSNLVAAIGDWLQDSNASAVIPDWLTLVESDINDRLRIQAMEVTDETFAVSSRLTALPTGFLEWRELRHSSSPYEKLDLVGADWANEHYSWIETGRPKRYLMEANQLRMVPTPDTSYDLTVTYYAALTPLGPSNASNWLLANSPNIYLFGGLSKSKGYLGDDSRISTWEMEYEKGLSELVRSDQRARWSGSTPAMRTRIAP